MAQSVVRFACHTRVRDPVGQSGIGVHRGRQQDIAAGGAHVEGGAEAAGAILDGLVWGAVDVVQQSGSETRARDAN